MVKLIFLKYSICLPVIQIDYSTVMKYYDYNHEIHFKIYSSKILICWMESSLSYLKLYISGYIYGTLVGGGATFLLDLC